MPEEAHDWSGIWTVSTSLEMKVGFREGTLFTGQPASLAMAHQSTGAKNAQSPKEEQKHMSIHKFEYQHQSQGPDG